MAAPNLAETLKYANLQMAAEARPTGSETFSFLSQ